MRIQLAFSEPSNPLDELSGGRIALTEIIEGYEEFLDELDSRLQAITQMRVPGERKLDLARSRFDGDATQPLLAFLRPPGAR